MHPVSAAAKDSLAIEEADRAAMGSGDGSLEEDSTVPNRILVVDDSDDTREMMAKLLELEAFTGLTAEDANIGLKLAVEQQPSLIITDINMPNMNGIEMIQAHSVQRAYRGHQRASVVIEVVRKRKEQPLRLLNDGLATMD